MSLDRRRVRRPDDWPSSHARARADLSDRVDAVLDPTEASWLDGHLVACPDCRSVADEYAAQRLELRALRDRMPSPPRDLWARTAAAIESESRFRDGRAPSPGWRRRRVLAPSALIAAALVVAVAAGVLTSSRHIGGGGDDASSLEVAAGGTPTAASTGGANRGPTPIAVAPKKVTFVKIDAGGTFLITTRNVDSVCPGTSADTCGGTGTTVDRPVVLDQDASTVFGSTDGQRLIVFSATSSSAGGSISVVPIGSQAPTASASPTASEAVPSIAASTSPPTDTPSKTPESPSAAPESPSTAPEHPSTVPGSAQPSSSPPSATPSGTPSPSVAVTPGPGGAIEIAHDVVLVGQSAAYSPSGAWFAFTARPVDGSVGPDIYVWKVGDEQATAVTTDHRSIFGSWSGDIMVASSVAETTVGVGAASRTELQPVSYLIDPATRAVATLPQIGTAWRPAVDPTGRLAVYWTGSVRTTDAPGLAPDQGRLVLGDWAATSGPSEAPSPTPLQGDQASLRHETTIEDARIDDWDARWDSTGTHLAVWIADRRNPAVGRLSLYAIDTFNGRIDLKKPLLDSTLAVAGYAISDGQLVWAAPTSADDTTGSQIQLLAWGNEGVGTVGTETGPVIVIR